MITSKSASRAWRLAAATALAGAVAFIPGIPTRAQSTVPATHGVPQHHLQIINMDIDFHPHKRPEQGKLSGYDPVVAVIRRGDRVQFVNTDDIRHTATGYAFGGQTIPENYRFQGDPSIPHGSSIGASEWSTGTVPPHGRSKIFNTGALGTFYFACAYHQSKGMRGAIIVKP